MKITREQVEEALVIAGKEAQKGVKEEGNNAGARVEQYLASVWLPKGNPWCAAFVSWSLKQAGLTIGPGSGRGATIRWRDWGTESKGRISPGSIERGDLGGWTNANGKGHIFWIAEVVRVNGKVVKFRTVEGNTDAQGSREGDGVYSKWRKPASNMWFIRLWMP